MRSRATCARANVQKRACRVVDTRAHLYATIHIDRPFDSPFVSIPGAYRTLMEYMRLNGLKHAERGVIPCFEEVGERGIDVYIACL